MYFRHLHGDKIKILVLDVQMKCDLADMEEFEAFTSEFDMSRAKKKVRIFKPRSIVWTSTDLNLKRHLGPSHRSLAPLVYRGPASK